VRSTPFHHRAPVGGSYGLRSNSLARALAPRRAYAEEPFGPAGENVEDRDELKRIVMGQTRVILTRDLSVMNPNLVVGAQGLVVGKLANYTLKVAFPSVTVGVNWQDCDLVAGRTGMPSEAEQPKVIPKPKGAEVE
jgi:hypothetical protein